MTLNFRIVLQLCCLCLLLAFPAGAAERAVRAGIIQFKPMAFFEDGKVRGLFVDLLEYAARQEQWRLSYIPGSMQEGLDRLERGELDLLLCVGYSPEQEKRFDFNKEYGVLDWGVVYQRKGGSIKSLLDLQGKRVSVLRNGVYLPGFQKMLLEFNIRVKLVEQANIEDILRSITTGEVDAGISSNLSGRAYAAAYPIAPTAILFAPVQFRFATTKEKNRDLLTALDRHLVELKADQTSLYYKRLEQWTSIEHWHPGQIWWAVALVSALAGCLLLVFLLKRIVKRQTADLERANLQLVESNARYSASEEKYRLLYEGAADAIMVHDWDMHVLDVNQVACERYGYSKEEFRHLTIPYLDSSEQTDQIPLRLAALREKGCAFFDTVHRTRNGTRIATAVSARSMVWDGQPAIMSICSDITSRIQFEERLLRLSAVVEQAPLSIVITDTRGTIEFVNPRFTLLTQYSSAEVLGQNPRIFKTHATPSSTHRELWETITSGQVWEGEFHNRKKDGEIFVEFATIAPIKNQLGEITHFMALKEDITEKRQLENRLNHAQKMEAIGQLAGGIAHDFNNILTVILGYCSLLKTHYHNDPVASFDIDQVSASAEKAAKLTSSLLAFSRKETVTLSSHNLNTIVQDMEEFLCRIIGEDIQLTYACSNEQLYVRVNSGQMEQLLMNCAANSRDAMPKGGTLRIATHSCSLDDVFMGTHGFGTPGRYAVLNITDSGTGMDENTRTRIFEPFFTTKKIGEGTGLGLAMAYSIVKQHNGYITVDSEPGLGTTVQVYLPLLEPAASEAGKGTLPAVKHGRETILVVEDDINVTEIVGTLLRRFGYEVLSAIDGRDGVEQFSANRDKVDLVLMDIIMPGMNGKEAAEKIKTIRPEVKILFTSGYTADIIRDRGDMEGDADIIMKPVKPMELLRKMREMLDNRTRFCSSAAC